MAELIPSPRPHTHTHTKSFYSPDSLIKYNKLNSYENQEKYKGTRTTKKSELMLELLAG